MSAEFLNAVFALAGVLLTGILALIGYGIKARTDLEKEIRTKHFERRLEVYARTVDFVWAAYQTGSRPITVEEAREVNKQLVLVASREVLRIFYLMAETSAEKLQRAGLNESEIRAKQTETARKILTAIRKDLYPHQEGLKLEDIRFIEPKQQPGAGTPGV